MESEHQTQSITSCVMPNFVDSVLMLEWGHGGVNSKVRMISDEVLVLPPHSHTHTYTGILEVPHPPVPRYCNVELIPLSPNPFYYKIIPYSNISITHALALPYIAQGPVSTPDCSILSWCLFVCLCFVPEVVEVSRDTP